MNKANAMQTNARKMNWLHVSGLSGSFSVHALAIVLLAIPVAAPSLLPKVEVIHASMVSPPPELPVVPLPPEPMPIKRPQRRVEPQQPAPPQVNEASVMAVPMTQLPAVVPDSAAGVASLEPTQTVATDSVLAYETVIQPDYPRDARKRGEHGTVVLSVLVGRDGLPKEVVVARSSGHRQLDREAREAVLRWRFRPVHVNGETVQARGLVPIKFDLSRS